MSATATLDATFDALDAAGITDAFEMTPGPGTVHVPVPDGTVFLSDPEGSVPHSGGPVGFVVGRTFADGRDEITVWATDQDDADAAFAALVEAVRAARRDERHVALVARMKREIGDDIEAGTVPAHVDDFGDLHSYVDANTYGGLCDEDDANVTLGLVAVAAAQDEVHEWLRAGRPVDGQGV
jgi:hypothetical protein